MKTQGETSPLCSAHITWEDLPEVIFNQLSVNKTVMAMNTMVWTPSSTPGLKQDSVSLPKGLRSRLVSYESRSLCAVAHFNMLPEYRRQSAESTNTHQSDSQRVRQNISTRWLIVIFFPPNNICETEMQTLTALLLATACRTDDGFYAVSTAQNTKSGKTAHIIREI